MSPACGALLHALARDQGRVCWAAGVYCLFEGVACAVSFAGY